MKRIWLAALIVVAVAMWAETPTVEPVQLSLPDLQGQQHTLAEYHGKIVVVNFWATWCGPCKHEMPLFADVVKRYGDRVQVLAVSLDDESTRSKIPTFAEKQKMSLPILLGSTEEMKKLGLGEGLPATAFIDSNGVVVARILGEVSKSELKERLDWMLVDKLGKEPAALVNNMNKKRDEGIMPVMR